MGKAKKSKPKAHKSPIGLASRDISDLEAEDRVGPINSILEQLQSFNNEDKQCGLQALSTLCQRESNTEDIVNSEVVKIVSPLLLDQDKNIRHAAAGALRNLSAVSVDICEKLVEQDISTPLLLLLNEYNLEWTPANDKKSNQLDQKSDTFLQAVNIIWNLCESTPVALEFFNQSQLLQTLVRCLNYEVFGMDIAISVGQLLLVISEDNGSAWRILANHEAELQSLLKISGDYQMVMLRTLVAGVVSNVPALLIQHLTEIIEALGNTIEVNHRAILNALTSKLPMNGPRAPQLEVVDDEMNEESPADASMRRFKEELPTELEQEVKHIGYLLSAQRISAEVLSNIVCSQEDEAAGEMEGDSDAESVQDYDASQANDNPVTADKIPVEIAEAVKAHQIVEKLWQRAQLLPENVKEILSTDEKTLYKRQNALRISSLLCLHNFCNCMSTDELGGKKAIYNVWLDLGQQILQIERDTDIVEASTSLMRAALDHLKGSPELFEQVTDSDLQLILQGIESCQHSEIRANWLRMLGMLGGCLPSEPLVKKVAEFILNAIQAEEDAWTLSEALDSFMDMFSDNDWNQVVYELNCCSRVGAALKNLKNKMRQQRKDLGDRYPAVATVKTNVSRFCKYLETQQKGFAPMEN